ncbi:dynein light chain LC6, flagellar outer arm-like [Lytechinus pictus]|uniref:dynein light chain LC6, flagellar outer arm-like n=1 Tax=Lytechinus pictus TaxID=7653 RepID=UPI00240E893E|nr:dynein light chain LC6, flagellar outer arm-like [Lytechinus pictus]
MSYNKKPSSIDKKSEQVVKNVDMDKDEEEEALEIAAVAFEKFQVEKDIAAHIKKEFDIKYDTTWHCVVGRNFGSYVTHESKHFIYFNHGQKSVLLFKSG